VTTSNRSSSADEKFPFETYIGTEILILVLLWIGLCLSLIGEENVQLDSNLCFCVLHDDKNTDGLLKE
jgi:hypothetical protein